MERRLVIKEKETGADSNAVVKVRRTYRVTFDAHINTAEKRKADFSDLKVADRINYRFTKSGEEFIIHKITPRGTESGNNKTESTH